MDVLALIAMLLALGAIAAAVSMYILMQRREKQRAKDVAAVAKAAQEYLSRFGIGARAVAATLASGHMMLMIETPPHKKLRFSYIIEKPIRNFIHVQTGIIVARVFWRFPISAKKAKVPEVQYVDPSTIPETPPQVETAEPPAVNEPKHKSSEDEEFDEYFYHQTYHIEEVSWEDFSTLAPDLEPATTEETLPETEKK